MSNNQEPAKMWSGRFREPLDRTFDQWQRSFPFDWRLLTRTLLIPICCISSHAQISAPTPPSTNTALVTFVSNPPSFKSGFPGQSSSSFTGNLFADQDQLASMKPGHFITISFVPGTYSFTATTWMSNGPAMGAHLSIDLAAHHHYFVELRSRASFPVTKQFGIKQIACEDAFHNNAHWKPLEEKRLAPAGKANVIAETSFPTCPATN